MPSLKERMVREFHYNLIVRTDSQAAADFVVESIVAHGNKLAEVAASIAAANGEDPQLVKRPADADVIRLNR
jgi:hypothetical protein